MQRGYLVLITAIVFLAIGVYPCSAGVTFGMELAASPDPVVSGNLLTYTITATNTGDEPSLPTIFFDYDPNLDYESGSPVSNQELWAIPVSSPAFWSSTDEPERIVQIGPGSSYVITVITKVKPDTPCGTPVTSTAIVSDPGNGRPPASATASVTTATSCGIPAPEFPSPLIPAIGLAGLAIAVLSARRVGRG